MTFLELCKKLSSEAGISTTSPVSTQGQIGMLAKIVSWVQEADLSIQSEFVKWGFLWSSETFSFVPDKKEYLPSALGMQVNSIEAQQIDCISFRGKPLDFMQWSTYLQTVKRNSVVMSDPMPRGYTVTPNGKVLFYPTPTLSETAEVDFYKTPVSLSENSDVSLIPAKFDLLIVYQALMLYAISEGDGEIYQTAAVEREKRFNELCSRYLPKITF